MTLLHGAARCGNTNIVKILLEEGVDVDIQNKVSSCMVGYYNKCTVFEQTFKESNF